MSTDTGSAGGSSVPGTATSGELGEDLAVQVAVQVGRVPAVREQCHGEPCVGKDAQERRLPDRVAVVPDEPATVPAEADPADSPRVAEEVLVGDVGLLLGHRGGALLAEEPRPVRRDAAGKVQPRKGQDIAHRRVDEARQGPPTAAGRRRRVHA